jgi:hypothetical protein
MKGDKAVSKKKKRAPPRAYEYRPRRRTIEIKSAELGKKVRITFWTTKNQERLLIRKDLNLARARELVGDQALNCLTALEAKGLMEAAGEDRWRITKIGQILLEALRARR